MIRASDKVNAIAENLNIAFLADELNDAASQSVEPRPYVQSDKIRRLSLGLAIAVAIEGFHKITADDWTEESDE